MICFFPTATHLQMCPVLIAAVAFAARKIGFVFSTGSKDGNRTGNCASENGFRLLGTERTQTEIQIAAAAWASEVTTRKGQKFSKLPFQKNAMRNDN